MYTNKAPGGVAYRCSFRVTEAMFFQERMVQAAADDLGMDQAEFRRMNFVRDEDFPHRTPFGFLTDSGQYGKCLDVGLKAVGYEDFRRQQQEARARGRLLGIGISTMTEPLFEFLSPRDAERPYTVSEINDGISLILESHNTLVWVEGEISNWRVSSNGHCYCKLKDSGSQIPAVLWRSAAAVLQFTPEDGLAVLVIATIRVYQKAGYYQLDIHRMEPRGKGALYLAFEQLTKRLEWQLQFFPHFQLGLVTTCGLKLVCGLRS
jgi:hypothetical protein